MLTISWATLRAADVGVINLDGICMYQAERAKQGTNLNSNALLLWTGGLGGSFGRDL